MASIVVDRVSVNFALYQSGSRSLKKRLLHASTGGRLGRDSEERVLVEALRDVSLTLKHGDRLGLVGPNGAGKTTLLRVLAGVYEPVKGQVIREGRVSPLFEVKLGIDTEATGEENILLRGLYLGFTPSQVRAHAQEIAEFTGLGDYLKMPVRTYSAGMALRLAFAVATSVKPDILLMDEWILAGDSQFMARAKERLSGFVGTSSILVLASHSLPTIRTWCNRALYLDHGRVVCAGPVDAVLEEYRAR